MTSASSQRPRLALFGIAGRMGHAIGEAAAAAGVPVVGGTRRDGGIVGGPPDAAALAAAADVLIDFTTPDALAAHLDIAVAAGRPLLIGTTGLGAAHHEAIDAAARRIPLIQAYNTSLGVNLLRQLVEEAARRLGPDWDIEIVETHHRHKLDTPSGTALLLGAAANAGRGAGEGALDRLDRMQPGPHPREEGGIYYASLRGGSVAGDHMVVFAGEGERLELGHRAESRAIFAKGAIRAATWLAQGRAPGRYAMTDVLAA